MSHFTIEKSGLNVRNGLVQVRYDLFWDDIDAEYLLIEVPIFPPEGYTGEDTQEAFDAWVKALPTQFINPPFCSHFVYFEPSVSDEEILFVGELALDMAEKNYRAGDVSQNQNLPFVWKPEKQPESAARLTEILSLDVLTVNNIDLYRVK